MIRKPVAASPVPVVCLIFILSALASITGARGDQIQLNAKIGGDMQRTRFVAFLSKKVEYRIFEIADPYRIVVDLPEVEIQTPSEKGRGLILYSRSGLLSPGKSRIVIDLVAPALVEKVELLPAENDLPVRFVLDLKKTTHQAFLAAAKIPPPVHRDEESRNAAIAENSEDKRPVIIVDPGHGGVDVGAQGRVTNTAEKDITFDFSMVLAEKLEATGRYRVLKTRDQDVFVPLDERWQLAAASKADLLVSIHADTLDVRRFGIRSLHEVRGGTIYTLSEHASDEQAGDMAASENKADVAAGVASEGPAAGVSGEINSILSDLESRSKKNRSLALANYLIAHLKDKMKFNSRPQRSANLRVLKAAGVPSILIELGYLSNDEDEKLLTSSEWRKSTATLIAKAIDAFMSEHSAQLPL